MEIDCRAIVRVLKYLDTIVVSLERIRSYGAGLSREERHRLTRRFVDQWNVTVMLAQARSWLSSPFSDVRGEDGMDELEREVHDVPYWRASERKPPPGFIEHLRRLQSGSRAQDRGARQVPRCPSHGDPIKVERGELVEILRYLETLVVSLDRVGSHEADLSQKEADEVTARFVEEWGVSAMLERARGVLSNAADAVLGDGPEQAVEDVLYWSPSSMKPAPEFVTGIRRLRPRRPR